MSDTSPFDFDLPPMRGTPIRSEVVSSGIISQQEVDEFIKRGESPAVKVTETQFKVMASPEWIEADDFTLIVSGVYHKYTETKRLPTIIELQRLTGVGAALIKRTLESDEFRLAVSARGIPWDNREGLSATQMLVAQIITNPTDRRELRLKLKQAGVTYPQYRAWMNQPAFSQYMHRITEGMLTDHIPDFNTVLTKKGLAGDLNAIKYINELSGRHDPNRQQVLDLQAVVTSLLDIIQRNVKDPETMKAIAAEFQLTMATKQQTIQGELK